MESKALIQTIESYCEAVGISPTTLGVKVLGNSRFLDRLKSRAARDEEAARRLIAYMAENPAPKTSGGASP
ncbi:hypothetical protein ACFSGJ_16525 [Halodurantibacterium flavum]|uniref:Uncharacterized protein n=1 Tax=Halodurantibacterium flavum TaxID=1382802 RepID=A0ABW4S8E7_9RHOB